MQDCSQNPNCQYKQLKSELKRKTEALEKIYYQWGVPLPTDALDTPPEAAYFYSKHCFEIIHTMKMIAKQALESEK